MALATRPFSRELSTLTSSIKQLHSTNREQARRIRPMDKSDKEHFTKRCLPGRGDVTRGRVIDKKNGKGQPEIVDKMAYIAAYVQKSCVSPTPSGCPVDKETNG